MLGLITGYFGIYILSVFFFVVAGYGKKIEEYILDTILVNHGKYPTEEEVDKYKYGDEDKE